MAGAPHRIPAHPRPVLRRALLAAGAVLLAAAPAASGRLSVLHDEAATVERLVADRPGGGPGLRLEDGIVQQQPARPVLPASRQALTVSGGAGTPSSPSLLGRGPKGMTALLRERVRAAGAHLVFVDEVDAAFRGREGDDLAAALRALARERAPWAPYGLARRVHLYVPEPGGLLSSPGEWGGARRAMALAGGVWLRAFRERSPWAAQEWLAWPSETARRIAADGGSRSRVHVVIRGGADHAASWRMARTGGSCAVLGTGPGAYRLGDEVDAFVAEFRTTFPLRPGKKSKPGGPVGCEAAGVLPAPAAAALSAAAGTEVAGLAIPPGGLDVPPPVAGEPAQLTLGLGPDPLELAGALGIAPEALWAAAGARVHATAPGAEATAMVEGDGSARLEFLPTAPGPVTMRLVVPGAALDAAPGSPVDVLAGLRRAGADDGLVRRVVADPAGWELDLPLVRPGGQAGDPVLEVLPPLA